MPQITTPVANILRGSILLAGLSLIAQPTVAQEGAAIDAIVACAAIADDTERLVCFDQLALIVDPAPNEADLMAELRVWTSLIDVSPIDGSPIVSLVRASDEANCYQFHCIAVLGLQCSENRTYVLIYFGGMIIKFSENPRIQYRIGDNAPVDTRAWTISPDYKGVSAPGGAPSIKIIRQLEEATDFYVRVTDQNGAVQDATFTLSGLSEVLVPLKSACRWS